VVVVDPPSLNFSSLCSYIYVNLKTFLQPKFRHSCCICYPIRCEEKMLEKRKKKGEEKEQRELQ
jgi:hypothetical protein